MLRIGVLIVSPIQVIDLAPVELFTVLTKDYLRVNGLQQNLVDAALPTGDVEIIYIAQSGPKTIADTIPGLGLAITAGIKDSNVAPGKLDVLFIPGTDPTTVPDEDVLKFVRGHIGSGAELMAVCTGIFVAAHSGVLDGKLATGPRGMLDEIRNTFEKVNWQDKRYVNDGSLWTCGQITNGFDMTAAYISHRWPGPLAETVLSLADIQVRPVEYKGSRVPFRDLNFD